MNYDVINSLVAKGLSTRKISTELKTSQSNVRYWLKKFNLTTKSLDCKTCGKILEGKRILFCSTKCKRFFHCREPISKQNNYAKQNQRGRERKLNLIKMKVNNLMKIKKKLI